MMVEDPTLQRSGFRGQSFNHYEDLKKVDCILAMLQKWVKNILKYLNFRAPSFVLMNIMIKQNPSYHKNIIFMNYYIF